MADDRVTCMSCLGHPLYEQVSGDLRYSDGAHRRQDGRRCLGITVAIIGESASWFPLCECTPTGTAMAHAKLRKGKRRK